MKMYQHIAHQIARLQNLQSWRVSRDNDAMIGEVHDALDKLVKDKLPSGSGFDAGTRLDIDNAKPNRYVFRTCFHHMDEHGGYDGWTEHDIVVTPCMLFGCSIRITGRNRNDIKDYIGEVFQHVLSQEYVA